MAKHKPLDVQVYKDRRGEWRWRLVASNGRTIADSGEGYKRKRDCLHGLKLVCEAPVRYTVSGK